MGQGYNKKAVPVCTPYILHGALVGAGSPLADPMKGVVMVVFSHYFETIVIEFCKIGKV
jgi:hypothetical protein